MAQDGDQVRFGERRRVRQDRQRHRLDIVRQAQRHVARQMHGPAQAFRQRLAHGLRDVLRHEPGDVLGDRQLVRREPGAVDLLRHLGGELGTHLDGRLRQQAGNVGVGEGGGHGCDRFPAFAGHREYRQRS